MHEGLERRVNGCSSEPLDWLAGSGELGVLYSGSRGPVNSDQNGNATYIRTPETRPNW